MHRASVAQCKVPAKIIEKNMVSAYARSCIVIVIETYDVFLCSFHQGEILHNLGGIEVGPWDGCFSRKTAISLKRRKREQG